MLVHPAGFPQISSQVIGSAHATNSVRQTGAINSNKFYTNLTQIHILYNFLIN